MGKLSDERKEYLKEYQKTYLKRVPLDVNYDMYIRIQQHMALYGKKKTVNGYIKDALNFVMSLEDAGLKDRVDEMLKTPQPQHRHKQTGEGGEAQRGTIT